MKRATTTLLLLGAIVATSPAIASVTLFRDRDFRGRHETFRTDVRDLRRSFVGNDRVTSVAVDPGCVARLYSDADFQGAWVEIRGDVADLRRTTVGNDRVSSLEVFCGERGRDGRYGDARNGAPAHRHDDRRWDEERYRDDGWRDRDGDRYRDDRRWDDHGGAYSRGGAALLFHDVGFRGRAIRIDGSIPDLERTALGNDTASSVAVPRGCEVVLYEDAYFRGRRTVLRGDVPDLRGTAVGNDRVSSVEVFCRR